MRQFGAAVIRETRQTVAMPERETRSVIRGLLFLAAVIALLWILATGRPPRPSLMWTLVYDLGHIPLFGVMAVCLFEASRALLGSGRVRGGTHYLVAFVLVAAISLLSELAQLGVVGREAQARDAVHNMIGAGAFLALRAVWDRSRWGQGDALHRQLLLVAAGLVLLLAFWPLVLLSWHYGMRQAAFPTLADFDSAWQQPFLYAPRVEREVVPAPAGWTGHAGRPVTRVTFGPRPWPGIIIREPYPDWRGYDKLRFQVYSELTETRPIVLWIEDVTHNDRRSDRYERTFTVQPGLNDFSVKLDRVRNAPAGREMALDQISFMMLFTRRPTETYVLYVGDIWLE
jgi:VanZ family protein